MTTASVTLDEYSRSHGYAVEVYRNPGPNTFARLLPEANDNFTFVPDEPYYIRVHNANMPNPSRSLSGQNYVLLFQPPEHIGAIFIPSDDYNTILDVQVNAYDQWYYFEAHSRSRFWVELYNNTGVAYNLSLFRLEGASLVEVSSKQNPPVGERFTHAIPAGTYYIRLSPQATPVPSNGLGLLINIIGGIDDHELNDCFETASLVSVNTNIRANIDHFGNRDFFRMNIPSAGRYEIFLGSIPAGHRYVVRVYNSNRLLVTTFNSTSWNYRIINLSAGRHYITVHSEVGYGTSHNYSLSVLRYVPSPIGTLEIGHIVLNNPPNHVRTVPGTVRYESGGRLEIFISSMGDWDPRSRLVVRVERAQDTTPNSWGIVVEEQLPLGSQSFTVQMPYRNINIPGMPVLPDGRIRITLMNNSGGIIDVWGGSVSSYGRP